MKVSIGNKATVASFDVDAQLSFTPICPKELPVPEGHLIVNELNKQAEFALFRIGSKEGHPPNAVWLACENHLPLTPISGEKKSDNVDVYWPAHCIPGTQGFELIPGLPHPAEYDFFVWKGIEPDMHPYGSCYHDMKEKLSTGVIEFLKNHGVKTVIVGGLATDYCVKNTVLQLLKAGFQTIVNLNACRGISPSTTQSAIREMQQKGAMIVESSNDLQLQHLSIKHA